MQAAEVINVRKLYKHTTYVIVEEMSKRRVTGAPDSGVFLLGKNREMIRQLLYMNS